MACWTVAPAGLTIVSMLALPGRVKTWNAFMSTANSKAESLVLHPDKKASETK